MNEIKKRWHGLRSCALRYFKRKSEHGDVKWAYWSDLSFLRESVAAEETGSEIAWSNQDTGKSELYNFIFITLSGQALVFFVIAEEYRATVPGTVSVFFQSCGHFHLFLSPIDEFETIVEEE